MKRKIFAFLASAIFVSLINSQNAVMVQDPQDFGASIVDEKIPAMLGGIWENTNRYVIFDTTYVTKLGGKRIPSVSLRNFYQYYVDRTAESDAYSILNPRPRNDSTSKQAQQMEIHFEPLTYELYPGEYNVPVNLGNGISFVADGERSGAWDMQVKYPHDKTIYHIPIAIIGNKLYLRFKIRELINPSNVQENSMDGFWRDEGNANGILVCPPIINSELLSYYVTNNRVYHIRYWETDMEFDGETQAIFNDGEKTYSVPKHLMAGDRVFTCVTGRAKKIRNISMSSQIPGTYVTNSVLVRRQTGTNGGQPVYETSKTSTICAFGEPYLTLIDGSITLEEIIEEAMKQRYPSPAPLFPVHGGAVGFDWSRIHHPPESYDRRMLDLGK